MEGEEKVGVDAGKKSSAYRWPSGLIYISSHITLHLHRELLKPLVHRKRR